MTDITDHYSIFTVCEDPEPIINRKFRERRDYNIKNIVKFINRLRSVNCEENLHPALLFITLQSSIIQSIFYSISRSQKKKL